MTRVTLAEFDAEDIDYVVAHVAQRDTGRLIAEFIEELRRLDSVDDHFEFQRDLAGAIYEAEQKLVEANRCVKRAAAGRTTPNPPGATWELERKVFERICRQLRCVGDALAWRLFGFNRRIILALSQHAPSGLMNGKDGLGHELGAVVAYREDGKFALLHSVTNCLRIADLTVFDDDMPRLQEIKASEHRGSRYRAQKRRAERAIAAINDGGLLGNDEAEPFDSSQPLKARFGVMRDALRLSGTDGHSSVVAGRQHVVTTYNLPAAHREPAAFLLQAESRKRRTFERSSWVRPSTT